jgi:GntR family transcriptional regulator, galactonate operon transcriptional repressor
MVIRRVQAKRRVHHGLVQALACTILAGEIGAGEALPNEAILCARHRVGRNALREAIKVLTAKGLVSARPRTGTTVCDSSRWKLLDADLIAWGWSTHAYRDFIAGLTEARLAIEPAAAALAAERATPTAIAAIADACAGIADADGSRHVAADVRFHQAVLAASGNAVFAQLGQTLSAALLAAFERTRHRLSLTEGERLHRRVLDAIVLRDPDRAHEAMRALLASLGEPAGSRRRR